MTWTRLFHIRNLPLAMTRVIPNQPRPQLMISRRYQAMIRKQFRLNGVPWIYNLQQPKENPRDKPPRPRKAVKKREQRLIRIQKALAENEKKLTEYRQRKLDLRKSKGLDKMIKKGLPSWIDPNFVDEDIPEYMKKQREKRLKEEGKKKKSPFQIY